MMHCFDLVMMLSLAKDSMAILMLSVAEENMVM